MEYKSSDGTKIIVEGDIMQYGELKPRKCIIGPNYTHGLCHAGYLSSFSGDFDDELIGIETGLADIVYSKIGDIKEAYELLKNKLTSVDITNIYELSRVVLETVDEYFNGIDNISERMNYYYSLDDDEISENKISNLKGKGAAMCVERAALSQNLLKTLGINSVYKSSGIIKNGSREVHSYNLIEFNGKYYIFDSTMPNLVDDKINPLIAEIDKDTFDLISAPVQNIGISVTVSHYNPYQDKDYNVTYDSGREKQIEVESLSKTGKKMFN